MIVYGSKIKLNDNIMFTKRDLKYKEKEPIKLTKHLKIIDFEYIKVNNENK